MKELNNTLFLALVIACLCSALEPVPSQAISVSVTATSSSTIAPPYGFRVELRRTISIVNSQPAYYYAIINWDTIYSWWDCTFMDSYLDDSWCCAFYGNSGTAVASKHTGCGFEATCSTYGNVGGIGDTAFAGCTARPCAPTPGNDDEPTSPIIFSLSDQRMELTDLDGGVEFDLNGDGSLERTSWTVTGADEAFLVLDRNGNGVIEDGKELFGDAAEQDPSEEPNGFLALAMFDEYNLGGNRDRVLSDDDQVFSSLQLWVDSNHDGVAQPAELEGLKKWGIVSIDLDYQITNRTDPNGNIFRYRGRAYRESGEVPIWDVFFMTGPVR